MRIKTNLSTINTLTLTKPIKIMQFLQQNQLEPHEQMISKKNPTFSPHGSRQFHRKKSRLCFTVNCSVLKIRITIQRSYRVRLLIVVIMRAENV